MKGKILIILPTDTEFDFGSLSQFHLPEGWEEYLDDRMQVMFLPEGGIFSMGEVSNDILKEFHKRIHEVTKDMET